MWIIHGPDLCVEFPGATEYPATAYGHGRGKRFGRIGEGSAGTTMSAHDVDRDDGDHPDDRDHFTG